MFHAEPAVETDHMSHPVHRCSLSHDTIFEDIPVQVWGDRMGLQIQRRAHIVWEDTTPRTVFIVKKSSSLATSQKLSEIGDWCAAAAHNRPALCSNNSLTLRVYRRALSACRLTQAKRYCRVRIPLLHTARLRHRA